MSHERMAEEQKGFTQISKLWLNLFSFRWLSPSLKLFSKFKLLGSCMVKQGKGYRSKFGMFLNAWGLRTQSGYNQTTFRSHRVYPRIMEENQKPFWSGFCFGIHIENLLVPFQHHLTFTKALSSIIMLRWEFICSKAT